MFKKEKDPCQELDLNSTTKPKLGNLLSPIKSHSKFFQEQVLNSFMSLQNAYTAYQLAAETTDVIESCSLFKLACTYPLILHHPLKIKDMSEIARTWPSNLQKELYDFLYNESIISAYIFHENLSSNSSFLKR